MVSMEIMIGKYSYRQSPWAFRMACDIEPHHIQIEQYNKNYYRTFGSNEPPPPVFSEPFSCSDAHHIDSKLVGTRITQGFLLGLHIGSKKD